MSVQVNETIYEHSVIVMPHKMIAPWVSKKFYELSEHDFQDLLSENIDVVLLGVGEHSERLPLELYYRLLEKKLVMNVLMTSSPCLAKV